MQNIIILDTNNDKVIVQAQEKVYMDTINNFFVDYGKEIEYKSIDYNCGTESCWLNGVAFQQYPNEICEDILKSIDELIDKKAAREYIALTFDELKAIKLSEVDAWTERKIAGGFISECTGEIVRYDSDKDTQLTVSSDLNTINSALDKFSEHYPEGYPMRGYPEGRLDKSVYYLSVEQLIKWNVDLGLHRGKCKQQGWSKQAEVAAALSKEELDAITLD